MSSKPTIIYLVRHGESVSNKQGIVSGQVDPALTSKGHQQAHGAKESLKAIVFDDAYSSDLQRAVKTTEIIFGKQLHESKQLPGLREKSYGSIEGKPHQHLEADRQERRALSKSESLAYKHVPDMESDGEVAERLFRELTLIAKKHPGQTILVGSHGTAIRIILMQLLNKHYREMPEQSFHNGGFVKLLYEQDKFVIEEVNGYNEPL